MYAEPETVLERCLAGRAEGQSLDDCFAGVPPELRRELEPLVLLVDALRAAPRAGLSPGGFAAGERRLLARAAELRGGVASAASANGTGRAASTPGSASWVQAALGRLSGLGLAAVPAANALLAIVILFAAGSAGTAVANARPDDVLYNFKLSWEQTQLLIASSDAQRARVYVDLAQNRQREAELLALEGRPIPDELILQMRQSLNQAIALTSGLRGDDAVALLRRISDLLFHERTLLSRYLQSLRAPDRPTVELALQEAEESQQAVSRALFNLMEEQAPGPASTVPAPTSTAAPETETPRAPPPPAQKPSIQLLPSAPVVNAARADRAPSGERLVRFDADAPVHSQLTGEWSGDDRNQLVSDGETDSSPDAVADQAHAVQSEGQPPEAGVHGAAVWEMDQAQPKPRAARPDPAFVPVVKSQGAAGGWAPEDRDPGPPPTHEDPPPAPPGQGAGGAVGAGGPPAEGGSEPQDDGPAERAKHPHPLGGPPGEAKKDSPAEATGSDPPGQAKKDPVGNGEASGAGASPGNAAGPSDSGGDQGSQASQGGPPGGSGSQGSADGQKGGGPGDKPKPGDKSGPPGDKGSSTGSKDQGGGNKGGQAGGGSAGGGKKS